MLFSHLVLGEGEASKSRARLLWDSLTRKTSLVQGMLGFKIREATVRGEGGADSEPARKPGS